MAKSIVKDESTLQIHLDVVPSVVELQIATTGNANLVS